MGESRRRRHKEPQLIEKWQSPARTFLFQSTKKSTARRDKLDVTWHHGPVTVVSTKTNEIMVS